MTVANVHALRDLADAALSEVNDARGDKPEHTAYLDGVEEALRWAAGDGTTRKIEEMLAKLGT